MNSYNQVHKNNWSLKWNSAREMAKDYLLRSGKMQTEMEELKNVLKKIIWDIKTGGVWRSVLHQKVINIQIAKMFLFNTIQNYFKKDLFYVCYCKNSMYNNHRNKPFARFVFRFIVCFVRWKECFCFYLILQIVLKV